MISSINDYHPPFKGYQHPLKTLFKKGLMPFVTRGIYGELINPSNVSLEHLRPHSKGGGTTLFNLALAERHKNSARGSHSLAEFLSWEMLEKYLEQFNFRIRGLFDGFNYQKGVRDTCIELGVGTNPKISVISSTQNSPKIPELLQFQPKIPKKILRSLRNKAKKASKLNVLA